MQKRMKVYRVFLSLCAAIFLFAGCGKEPQELVPARGNLLLFVKMKQVIQDRDLSQAMKIDELKSELDAVDITPKDISQMMLFMGSAPSSERMGYLGMILEGDYDAKQKVKQLAKQGWDKKRHLKDEYYYNPASGECIAYLNGNTMVFGSKEALCDVLDVRRGKKKSLIKHPTYNKLAKQIGEGSAPITMHIIVPQEVLDIGQTGLELSKTILELLNVGAIGVLLGKIGLVQGLGMSINHSGNDFPVEMLCLMQSEGAASFISGSLNLLKGISTMLPKGQMSAQERQNIAAFQNMGISRDGEMLKINMVIPRREFLGYR
ncbi:MAG: hypothetical protein H8D67_19850 [Deltaproteobacteria bacterium]|nr:hypothetical protein [Deltaproteobacteria bacterium]